MDHSNYEQYRDTGLLRTSTIESIGGEWPSHLRRRPVAVKDVSPNQQKFQLQLHTTGAYGVKPLENALLPDDFLAGEPTQTQHRLYQKFEHYLTWKPWLSGSSGRLIQLLIIVATVICHKRLVSLASHGGHGILFSIGPPVLGIISARLILFIASQEKRRLANRPLESLLTIHHQRTMQMQTALLFLLFAPLISIPLRPTVVYESVVLPNGEYMPRCFDFNRLIDDIPQELPETSYQSAQPPSPLDPSSGFSSWSASLNQYRHKLVANRSDTLKASLIINQDRTDRNSWLWGRANASHVLYQPFFPPRVLPEHPVSVSWENPSADNEYRFRPEGLTGTISCKIIEVLKMHTNFSSNPTAIDLDIMDPNGCGASLSLISEHLATNHRKDLYRFSHRYQEFLDSPGAINTTDDLFNEKAKFFRPHLARYLVSIGSDKPIITVRPQWSPVLKRSEIDTTCKNTLLLAVPTDPFILQDSSQQAVEVVTASCIPDFSVFNYNIHHGQQFWNRPFLNQGSELRELQYHESGMIEQYKFPPTHRRNTEDTVEVNKKLSSFLATKLSGMDIFKSWSPANLIEYQFMSTSWDGQTPYYAVAYAVDRLLSDIFERLSAAASVASRQCHNLRNRPLVMQRSFDHLKERVMQEQIWFRVLFWLSVYGLVYCTIVTQIDADDSPSGMRWSTSSIAARAALLCRSRLRECLSIKGVLPEDIKPLNPIRIGHWFDTHKGQSSSWRADSLLHECKVESTYEATPERNRFSFGSLPKQVHPFAGLSLIVSSISVVYLSSSAAKGLRVFDSDEFEGSSLVPIMLGTQWTHGMTFRQTLALQAVPSLFSVGLTIYWWSTTISFYKNRLPWVELLRSNEAKRSLTLDYQNMLLPVKAACLNKHWMLAGLILGECLIFALPILTGNIFDLQWKLDQGRTSTTTQKMMWQPQHLHINFSNVLQETFLQVLRAQNNASMLPQWSSYHEALNPVDVGRLTGIDTISSLKDGLAGYWGLNTSSIGADLQCTQLNPDSIYSTSKTSQQTMSSFEALKVSLRNTSWTDDGHDTLTAFPCSGTKPNRENKIPLFCSHWELKALGHKDVMGSIPVWVISAAYFDSEKPSTQVLLCQPQLSVAQGEARLLSMTGKVKDAFVHSYTPTDKHTLTVDTVWEYSKLLNSSISTPTSPMYDRSTSAPVEEFRFTSPTVSSPSFHGDLLSYMAYRDMSRNNMNLNDSKILEATSKLAFSSFFATLAQTSNLFKTSTTDMKVSVTTLTWHEELIYHKATVKLVLTGVSIVLFAIVTHIVIMFRCKEYLFPIAPEPIQNTWFFLYRSSIVKMLEENIPKPETLTLEQFNNKVHNLGHKYTFGHELGDNSWTDLKVDTIEHFKNSNATDTGPRYRDNQESIEVESLTRQQGIRLLDLD